MQWQPRSTIAPPPACSASQNQAECGPGWVSRAGPRHLADLAATDCLHRLERLRRVDEVLEVPGEDARVLGDVEHPLRLLAVPRQGFRAEDRLAMRRAELERLEVQVVGQADHDRVGIGVRDGLREVGGDHGHLVLAGERLGTLL